MQIHELTNPRRNLREGNPLAALKGIASVAAQGINSKLGTNIGGAAAGASVGLGSSAQLAAAKLNSPLIKQLAQTMEKTWLTQSLPTLMQQENVAEPALVTPAILKEELTELINKTLTFDFRNPNVSSTAQGGVSKIDADRAVKEIELEIEKIIKYPPAGTGKTKSAQEYTTAFQVIATAMTELKNLSTFASGQAANRGVVRAQASPAAQQVADKLALEPDQIETGKQLAASNPAAFKELFGLK